LTDYELSSDMFDDDDDEWDDLNDKVDQEWRYSWTIISDYKNIKLKLSEITEANIFFLSSAM
jgi:hypothetical protein